jgi:hypothetical protein
MPRKPKLQLYIVIYDRKTREYTLLPFEKWLASANKKQIYNFIYKVRLKALEIAKVKV